MIQILFILIQTEGALNFREYVCGIVLILIKNVQNASIPNKNVINSNLMRK